MWQKFWQHFLDNKDILQKIARTIFDLKKELNSTHLIEVWPWKGVLTKEIISPFKQVTLYEIDSSLKLVLQKIIQDHINAKIVRWDVLKGSLNPGSELDTLVVWNLPYYITSPILRLFFESHNYPWWVFMVQKEVAEKAMSNAKKKSYLRWMLNYENEVTYEFTVPASAFNPPPKVQSAVISIRCITNNNNTRPSFYSLQEFLDIVSQFKRKTLWKIWKMRKDDLSWFHLPEHLMWKRIEELERIDMKNICG